MPILVHRDPVDVDPAVQKYGEENMPASRLQGMGAAGEETLLHGALASALTAYSLDDKTPAESAEFLKSRQQTFNALEDIQHRMPDGWYSTFNRGIGDIGGFATQPVTAAVGAITGPFLGELGEGIAAKLVSNKIAQMGIKAVIRGGATTAISSAPGNFARAALDENTPIQDDYNYLDAMKDTAYNSLYGSSFDIGGQAIGHFMHHLRGNLTQTMMPNSGKLKSNINALGLKKGMVQFADPGELRKGFDQAAAQIDNDKKVDVSLQAKRAFNAQRAAGVDPSLQDISDNVDTLNGHITNLDSQIADKQREVDVLPTQIAQDELTDLNNEKRVTQKILVANQSAKDIVSQDPIPISPQEQDAWEARQVSPDNSFFQNPNERPLATDINELPDDDDFELPANAEGFIQQANDQGLLDDETVDNIKKTNDFAKALPKFQRIITRIADCVGVRIG